MIKKFAQISRRCLRDSNLVLIGAALAIAVASVTSVDTFTDRVRRAINQQANALLAADVAILSSQALPDNYRENAQQFGLATAKTTAMRSVISHGDELQLIELKAVSEGYPLRGEIISSSQGVKTQGRSVPRPKTVWVEQRLLHLLNLKEGDKVTIGELSLTIDRTLLIEPDRAGSLFNLAPRVMMNDDDLNDTKLVLPGSRLTNTLLVAGDQRKIEAFRQSLNLRDTDKIRTPDEARPEVRSAIERADHFLNLAALTAIFLAGVAIALAARAYTDKNTKSTALLRVLGATRRQVLNYHVAELSVLAVLSIGTGVIIGFVAQLALATLVAGWVQGDLPPAGFVGISRAIFIGIIALFGFALPYLLSLRNTPPGLVLRPTMEPVRPKYRVILMYSLIAIILITPWENGSGKLTGLVSLGIFATLFVLGLIGHLLMNFLYRSRQRFNFLWRFGVTNLWRRKILSLIQISGLALGLTVLLSLALIRSEIITNWVNQLPDGAPNQFLINIQPDELESLGSFFADNELSPPEFYPMIRARLTAINGKAIDLDDFSSPQAKRLANREFNLSWSDELKPDNEITAGQWWASNSNEYEFSFEKDIAESLKVNVGDVIEYATAGEKLSGRISSLREVQWDTMGVNFFVEGTPALLQGFPATYITSFYLPPGNTLVLATLVREFPSVTVLDVTALIGQVQSIMNKASRAIEFVAVFTIIAGILVLIAATQTTQKERNFNTALLKTLGSSRRYVFSAMAVEFSIVGAIAGITATIAAQACTWLIATQVLKLSYEIKLWLIPAGALFAAIVVTAVGLVAVGIAFRQPSRDLLSA